MLPKLVTRDTTSSRKCNSPTSKWLDKLEIGVAVTVTVTTG